MRKYDPKPCNETVRIATSKASKKESFEHASQKPRTIDANNYRETRLTHNK